MDKIAEKLGSNYIHSGPKSAEKAPFFTLLKAAILIHLCRKKNQNNGSNVYENLALFLNKIVNGV